MFREARDDGGTGKHRHLAPPEHDDVPSSQFDCGARFGSRCLPLWRAARCPMPLSKSKEPALRGRGPSSVSHRVFEDYPPQFPPRNPAQRAVAGPIVGDGKVGCYVSSGIFVRQESGFGTVAVTCSRASIGRRCRKLFSTSQPREQIADRSRDPNSHDLHLNPWLSSHCV